VGPNPLLDQESRPSPTLQQRLHPDDIKVIMQCSSLGFTDEQRPNHISSTSIVVTVTVTDTELHSSTTFSEESCSVGLYEKMGFQLRSELLATVVR